MKRLCIYMVVLVLAGLAPLSAWALPTSAFEEIRETTGTNPFSGVSHWNLDFEHATQTLYQDHTNPAYDNNPSDFDLYYRDGSLSQHDVTIEASNAVRINGDTFSTGLYHVASQGGDAYLDNDYDWGGTYHYFSRKLSFDFSSVRNMGFSFESTFNDPNGDAHNGVWQMTAYAETLDGSDADTYSFYLNTLDSQTGGADDGVYGLRFTEDYRNDWTFTKFELNLVSYSLTPGAASGEGYYIRVDDIRLTPVPPAVWLLGSGLLGLIGLRKRIGF